MVKRKIVSISMLLLAAATLGGCAAQTPAERNPSPTASATPAATSSTTPSTANSITYSNTRYGFTFTLPTSWTGYKIVSTTWQGWDSATGKVVQTGPMLSIRHPPWTAASKRQDIPILIYTLTQWNSLMKEKFNMGAAPIPPSELGRNASYVFALPARYNYAFPTGYQEVEQILQSSPLHPTWDLKPTPPPTKVTP